MPVAAIESLEKEAQTARSDLTAGKRVIKRKRATRKPDLFAAASCPSYQVYLEDMTICCLLRVFVGVLPRVLGVDREGTAGSRGQGAAGGLASVAARVVLGAPHVLEVVKCFCRCWGHGRGRSC